MKRQKIVSPTLVVDRAAKKKKARLGSAINDEVNVLDEVTLPPLGYGTWWREMWAVWMQRTPRSPSADLLDVRMQVMQALEERQSDVKARPFAVPVLPRETGFSWLAVLMPVLGLGLLGWAVWWWGQTPPEVPQLTLANMADVLREDVHLLRVEKVGRDAKHALVRVLVRNKGPHRMREVRVGVLVADAAGRPLKAMDLAFAGTLMPYGQLEEVFSVAMQGKGAQRYVLDLPWNALQVQPLVLSAQPAP